MDHTLESLNRRLLAACEDARAAIEAGERAWMAAGATNSGEIQAATSSCRAQLRAALYPVAAWTAPDLVAADKLLGAFEARADEWKRCSEAAVLRARAARLDLAAAQSASVHARQAYQPGPDNRSDVELAREVIRDLAGMHVKLRLFGAAVHATHAERIAERHRAALVRLRAAVEAELRDRDEVEGWSEVLT